MNERLQSARTQDALERDLRWARLFRGLEPRTLEWIAGLTTRVTVNQGEYVWNFGRAAEQITIILRGLLELRRSLVGRQPTLSAIWGPGESPALWVPLQQTRYQADAVPLTPSIEILRIPAKRIIDAAASDASIANALTRGLLEQVHRLHEKVDVLAAGPVERRLASFFLSMLERFGDECEDGTWMLPVPLSRAQIASYVGARVETTIRSLSAWQKRKWLESAPDHFVVRDVAALRALMDRPPPS